MSRKLAMRALLVVGFLISGFGPDAFATETVQPKATAYRTNSPAGSILLPKGEGRFELFSAKSSLTTDQLYLLLPTASIIAPNGGVGVSSRSDLSGDSATPVLDTAILLVEPGQADLSIILDRGRIILANRKPSGQAVARVKVHDVTWIITLEKPETRVAIEVSGRWPAGTRYRSDRPPGESPTFIGSILVLNGVAQVFDGKTTLSLFAPPGPARTNWTSGSEAAAVAVRVDQLPEWAAEATTAQATELQASLKRFQQHLADNPETALQAMLTSEEIRDRRVGLVACGAVDDLTRLTQAVAASSDLAIWDLGITVIRHWLGRGPNQDHKLFNHLTRSGGMTPSQAQTVFRLLNGLSNEDLKRPESFEVLVEYLLHPQPLIRNLSAWNLRRLIPEGKSIPFRPNAGKVELEQVYNQWKALVAKKSFSVTSK